MEEDPFWAPGRIGLAETLVSLDKEDEAISIYAAYLEIPGVPLALARLMVRRQLRLPDAHRRWDDVERVLATAHAKASSDSYETEAVRAEMMYQRRDYATAEALLTEIHEKHPEEVSLWVALANLNLNRGDRDPQTRQEQSAAVLNEACRRFGDRLELILARVRQARQAGTERGPQLLAELERVPESFRRSERSRLFEELAQAFAQFDLLDKALTYWQKAGVESPNTLEVHVGMANAAVRLADRRRPELALERLREIEGGDSANANYAVANDILGKAAAEHEISMPAADKARKLLTKAAKMRPTWLTIPRALGHLESLLKNEDAAFDHFRHALWLGDNSRDTVFRVVCYLYLHRRFDEAHDEIRRIAGIYPDLFPGDLGRPTSDLAGRRQQFDDALRMTVNSDDYRDLILQAQIKMAKGELGPEIEELLEKACQTGRQVPQVWFMRIAFLARANLPDKVVTVIAQIEERVPDNPKSLKPLTLALCYEALRDVFDAGENYLKALEMDPRNIRLQRTLISFYLRNNMFKEADAHVDRILDPSAKFPSELVEDARRAKAIIMASGGGSDDLASALKMLNKSESLAEISLSDLRPQALILGRSSLRRDQIRLIGVLEEIARRQELSATEKHQLARLYVVTGRWSDALAAYRKLKDNDPANPTLLFEFATAMLDQTSSTPDVTSELSDAVAQLQRLEPDSYRTAITRARLLSRQDQHVEAVAVLQAYLMRIPNIAPETLLCDLVQQQRPSEAIAALSGDRSKKEDPTGREILERVQKLMRVGNDDDALGILQRYVIGSDDIGAVQGEIIRVIGGFVESIAEYGAAEEALRMSMSRSKQPEAVTVAGFVSRAAESDRRGAGPVRRDCDEQPAQRRRAGLRGRDSRRKGDPRAGRARRSAAPGCDGTGLSRGRRLAFAFARRPPRFPETL